MTYAECIVYLRPTCGTHNNSYVLFAAAISSSFFSFHVLGWSQTSGFPQHNDEDIALAASLAMGSNIVIGCLFQIPNGTLHYCIFA